MSSLIPFITSIISDFVSGVIKDVSGSYVGCVHFLNACTIITILMYSIELTYARFKKCNDLNDS